MIIRISLLLLLTIPLAAVRVNAQTACPSGVTPGSAQCGPSPVYHGISGSTNSVYRPTPQPIIKYADRWGAIATDGPKGILGTAVGMKNKRAAEKKALSDCVSKGGDCKIKLAFFNQCASLVSGNEWFYVQSAPTEQEAKNNGIERCAKEDIGCRVHYYACSMAERIR